MSKYDFAAFIDEVKDLSFKEMLSFTERTLNRAENASYGRKRGLHARQQGALGFANEVGEFLFFLRTGIKPSTVSEFNWPLYRKPVENLVRKGQMKASALDLFEK